MNIILLAIYIAGIMYFLVGIYAWRLTKPMHFWSGLKVREKDLKDVKKYNRANGIMWMVYASVYIVCALIAHAGYMLSALIVMIVGSSIGLIILMYTYIKIYDKYRIKMGEDLKKLEAKKLN